MPVSATNSLVVYEALKAAGVGLISALPETWLVHLIRLAEDDPAMLLVRLAKEEEGVGISTGAHFAGLRSALLMQNHGFLQAINGIASLALLYKIPLLMLVSDRGHLGRGQVRHLREGVLRAWVLQPGLNERRQTCLGHCI